MRQPERDPFEGIGWTIFILECADGSYATGFCSNLKKKIASINFFHTGHYKTPVKVIYKETNLPFKEAFSKAWYMKNMDRRLRNKIINTGRWPIGGAYKEYLMTGRASPRHRGKRSIL